MRSARRLRDSLCAFIASAICQGESLKLLALAVLVKEFVERGNPSMLRGFFAFMVSPFARIPASVCGPASTLHPASSGSS
jgi:hypothetical protein